MCVIVYLLIPFEIIVVFTNCSGIANWRPYNETKDSSTFQMFTTLYKAFTFENYFQVLILIKKML